jgi:hypothetical protein
MLNPVSSQGSLFGRMRQKAVETPRSPENFFRVPKPWRMAFPGAPGHACGARESSNYRRY